jgi:hypothetical protein
VFEYFFNIQEHDGGEVPGGGSDEDMPPVVNPANPFGFQGNHHGNQM